MAFPPPCSRRGSPSGGRSAACGLSLVELMVSMAIGLFLVAVGSTLLVAQMREDRRLLVEVRLMQDLRTAADLLSRDLRREGYWGRAAAGAWTPGSGSALPRNPYLPAVPDTAASDGTRLRYSRDAVENDVVDGNEQFGYRLRSGSIELQLGSGNWQALTDNGSLVVTGLQIVPQQTELVLADACSRACPAVDAGGATCPPRQRIRRLAVTITARAATDAAVVRSLRTAARVRNDAVVGSCPAA